MRENLVFLSLTFPLLLLLLIDSCFQESSSRQPVKYLIPADYVGWVRVQFEVKGEPELPVEEGFLICKFSEKGELKTSSRLQYGTAQDEYYYYSGQERHRLKLTTGGRGGLIWGGFNGQESDGEGRVSSTYLQFFVGEEQLYKRNASPGRTKPGPITP